MFYKKANPDDFFKKYYSLLIIFSCIAFCSSFHLYALSTNNVSSTTYATTKSLPEEYDLSEAPVKKHLLSPPFRDILAFYKEYRKDQTKSIADETIFPRKVPCNYSKFCQTFTSSTSYVDGLAGFLIKKQLNTNS